MKRQVNKSIQRDEFYDRLSSFLLQKGMLESNEISTIKPHVFYLKTIAGNELILKKHSKQENVKQQWDFFEQMSKTDVVPFTRYPNGQKVISDVHAYWTIMPYITGDKLYYKYAADRTEAVRTLQCFHSQAANIYVAEPIKKENIFIRWYWRLLAFKKTKSLFEENGFMSLYHDIVKITIMHLQFITQFPWEQYEADAIEKGLWIHGDVASHNFIHSNHLIDFDLLQSTAQIYDYIQLGQRFLPHLNWDVEKLLAYQMVKDNELKAWLSAIFIPTDLLREWLYFIKSAKTSIVSNYLRDMEKEWTKRLVFLKNAKSMLKSI